VVAVVSILVLGERISPLSSIGVILAITGMILIGLEARQ
jgi:drug/metabolite transporter (DMT)-like permease